MVYFLLEKYTFIGLQGHGVKIVSFACIADIVKNDFNIKSRKKICFINLGI